VLLPVVQRYGAAPVKPPAVLDAMSSCSGQSQSQSAYSAAAARYSAHCSVGALIARLVSSSVRFNADLPLANVFTSPAHLLVTSPPHRGPAAPAAGDNKVPASGLQLPTHNIQQAVGIIRLRPQSGAAPL